MNRKPFILSIFFLLITMVLIYGVSRREMPRVINTNLEQIPMQILGRTAVETFFTKAIYEELNADKHVYRQYMGSAGNQIDLYIGYYGTAKGGRTPHNPYACLPSQGWAIIDTGTISMQTNYTSKEVFLNYVISTNNNLTKYMIHWYQSAGTKVLDSGFKRNIQRFIGKIIDNRNDGAYVQLSIITKDFAAKEIPEALKDFAHEILNILPEHWPEER